MTGGGDGLPSDILGCFCIFLQVRNVGTRGSKVYIYGNKLRLRI